MWTGSEAPKFVHSGSIRPDYQAWLSGSIIRLDFQARLSGSISRLDYQARFPGSNIRLNFQAQLSGLIIRLDFQIDWIRFQYHICPLFTRLLYCFSMFFCVSYTVNALKDGSYITIMDKYSRCTYFRGFSFPQNSRKYVQCKITYVYSINTEIRIERFSSYCHYLRNIL